MGIISRVLDGRKEYKRLSDAVASVILVDHRLEWRDVRFCFMHEQQSYFHVPVMRNFDKATAGGKKRTEALSKAVHEFDLSLYGILGDTLCEGAAFVYGTVLQKFETERVWEECVACVHPNYFSFNHWACKRVEGMQDIARQDAFVERVLPIVYKLHPLQEDLKIAA